MEFELEPSRPEVDTSVEPKDILQLKTFGVFVHIFNHYMASLLTFSFFFFCILISPVNEIRTPLGEIRAIHFPAPTGEEAQHCAIPDMRDQIASS